MGPEAGSFERGPEGASGRDGLARARELDAADELAPLRSRFSIPPRRSAPSESAVYLTGNSLGLQPVTVREAVEQELEDWAALAVGAHFEGRDPWYSYHEKFKEPGARLVGARPSEVVMMNGLTVNLHLMLVSFYRPTRARHKILVEAGTFPSDLYAVKSQIGLSGFDPEDALVVAEPRDGEETLRTEDVLELLARRGDEIALVLFGGVSFITGQLFDMRAITAAGHRAGCTVGFDLAHAAGNVPLRLHDWDVDFAVWCSYKYLNAGPGAVAGCFVHERHGSDASLPRLAGWWGNDPETRFRMQLEQEFVPREGADGWQLSNPPILAMAPLKASLAIIDEVGMERLREKSLRLTGYMEELLDRRLGGTVDIVTPRDPGARGCQLSLRLKGDVGLLRERMEEDGVICDARPPDVLRVAPVPLYNRYEDVWLFVDALGRAKGE